MTETKAKAEPKAEPQGLHVLVAMSAIIAALSKEGISKSRENKDQKYNFRGIDNVLNALAPLLAEHKLIIIPKLMSRERTERLTKSGTVLSFVVVEVSYLFQSAQDNSFVWVGPFPGEGMDVSDKATNKAMSAAYKYMAIQTFCIPTEGESDADAETPVLVAAKPPPPKPQQVRASAKPFVDNSIDLLGKAAGSIDAVSEVMDAIKAKPGWKQLTEYERLVIGKAKLAALPDEPELNDEPPLVDEGGPPDDMR